MKLSEPELDKLTAESVENSYVTHDGKNKCLIADLQSNIYHYTVHTDIISGLAAMISWSNTISQFIFIVVPTIEYRRRKVKFYIPTKISKFPSNQLYLKTFQLLFFIHSLKRSIRQPRVCSCEASEPEIVFVDIQKHREFPFGHLHEKDVLDMDAQLTCRRAQSTASGCFLCESLWNVTSMTS